MKFFNFLSLIFDSVFRFRFRFRIPDSVFGASLCFNIDVTFYVLEIRVAWIKTLRSASVSIPLHACNRISNQTKVQKEGGVRRVRT